MIKYRNWHNERKQARSNKRDTYIMMTVLAGLWLVVVLLGGNIHGSL